MNPQFERRWIGGRRRQYAQQVDRGRQPVLVEPGSIGRVLPGGERRSSGPGDCASTSTPPKRSADTSADVRFRDIDNVEPQPMATTNHSPT
jgi:hypothetical protein